jgi:hypothetical protein
MAKYLTDPDLLQIGTYVEEICNIRSACLARFELDILSTDNLSSVLVYEIVSQYDADFNINFARNGEDATSNGVRIEMKNCSLDKLMASASFMFHAMGDLHHPRYIFVARDKKTLKPIKLYDISEPTNVALVQAALEQEKKEYLKKGFRKFDGIYIKEKYFKEVLNMPIQLQIKNCKVIKDS